MKSFSIAAVCILMLAACGEKAGQPKTETAGTEQAVSETSTASATTTDVTAGTSSAMAPEDKEFVIEAGMDVRAGGEISKLAVQKATNADVKALAQRMVADHTKMNEELQQFATTKGVALPTELDQHHKGGLGKLAGLSGAEFDKAFMHHIVEGHKSAVSELEKASTSAADADLRALVGKTLPMLREHLSLAQQVFSDLTGATGDRR